MNRKWTLFTFSRGDFKTIEQYLNEQAERGWELEKTGILAKWKRTERSDLTYCVDLAKPRQDRNARLDYTGLCAEGGWELASLTGGMYIFKSRPSVTPIPIQTDPELERRQYNRYYIRNTILSVIIIIAYFAFFLSIGAALGTHFEEYVQELRYQHLDDWGFAALRFSLPLFGLWAGWKLIDFVRAIFNGRSGRIGRSPRWVMWLNSVLALAAGIGAFFFLAGYTVETILGEDFIPYLFLMSLTWGGTLLYRALEIERELFPRERRRHIVGGVLMLAVFVLLIVGRVNFKAGNWSTSTFSTNREKGAEVYAYTHELPLVHGEDVGIPFLPEDGESVYVYHEILPVGERWELSYIYGSEKFSYGFLNVGCAVYRCFTEKQAMVLTEALANGYELSRYVPWPESGLTAVEIDWADEAWYGEKGENISILVLRAGDQVVRMIYPANLLSGENLAIIKAELEK